MTARRETVRVEGWSRLNTPPKTWRTLLTTSSTKLRGHRTRHQATVQPGSSSRDPSDRWRYQPAGVGAAALRSGGVSEGEVEEVSISQEVGEKRKGKRSQGSVKPCYFKTADTMAPSGFNGGSSAPVSSRISARRAPFQRGRR